MDQLLEIMKKKRISASAGCATSSCYNDQYKHIACITYGKQWREVPFRLQ